MLIDGRQLADDIIEEQRSLLTKTASKPVLVILTVQPTPEIKLFIKNKKKAAEKLGIAIEVLSFPEVPYFADLGKKVQTISAREDVYGIVIQQPLPASLSTDSLLHFLPIQKEIESFTDKSPYTPPLGLAVLTTLKQMIHMDMYQSFHQPTLCTISQDKDLFKQFFKRKKVLLIGNGPTGGVPIGKALRQTGVPFINIYKDTANKREYIEEADVIISAAGSKTVDGTMLKQGVWLISAGYRQENGLWKGDYDEEEIKDIATFYTPTPGGIGPLDIACLLSNFVQSVVS